MNDIAVETAAEQWRDVSPAQRAAAIRSSYDRDIWMTVFHRQIEAQRRALLRGGTEASVTAAAATLAATLSHAERFFEAVLASLLALAPANQVLRSVVAAQQQKQRALCAAAHWEASQQPMLGADQLELERAALAAGGRALVYLGDIARYRRLHCPSPSDDEAAAASDDDEGTSDTPSDGWAAAHTLYSNALQLVPASGNAHNQLAVIATHRGAVFNACMHYCCALSAMQPFDVSRANLAGLLRSKALAARQLQQRDGGGAGGPSKGSPSARLEIVLLGCLTSLSASLQSAPTMAPNGGASGSAHHGAGRAAGGSTPRADPFRAADARAAELDTPSHRAPKVARVGPCGLVSDARPDVTTSAPLLGGGSAGESEASLDELRSACDSCRGFLETAPPLLTRPAAEAGSAAASSLACMQALTTAPYPTGDDASSTARWRCERRKLLRTLRGAILCAVCLAHTPAAAAPRLIAGHSVIPEVLVVSSYTNTTRRALRVGNRDGLRPTTSHISPVQVDPSQIGISVLCSLSQHAPGQHAAGAQCSSSLTQLGPAAQSIVAHTPFIRRRRPHLQPAP